jgi:hypothetical protein
VISTKSILRNPILKGGQVKLQNIVLAGILIFITVGYAGGPQVTDDDEIKELAILEAKNFLPVAEKTQNALSGKYRESQLNKLETHPVEMRAADFKDLLNREHIPQLEEIGRAAPGDF